MKAGGADAGARESHIIEKMKSSAAAGGNSNTNANTTSSGGGSGAAAAAAAAAKGSGSDTVGGSHATTEANSNLLRALRMSEATNETGYATLQQLGRQKETIGRTLDSVGETRSELRGAQRTIRDIRMGVYKEWIVKGLVLLLLLLLDLVLFYTKFIRKRMRNYNNFNRVWKAPRRPFEKERLDREMRLCGQYGLRCKREIWRVNMTLSKMRRTARLLLTLPENHPRRQLEGSAIMRRCHEYGFLEEDKDKLDYVLSLTVPDILERRLQTVVFKHGLAKSVHHSRTLIQQRHIAVAKQIVTIPSFIVRVSSEHHIAFADASPFGNGRMGRVKRVKAKAAKKAAAGGGAADDDE